VAIVMVNAFSHQCVEIAGGLFLFFFFFFLWFLLGLGTGICSRSDHTSEGPVS
jgi:hypothetical protein